MISSGSDGVHSNDVSLQQHAPSSSRDFTSWLCSETIVVSFSSNFARLAASSSMLAFSSATKEPFNTYTHASTHREFRTTTGTRFWFVIRVSCLLVVGWPTTTTTTTATKQSDCFIRSSSEGISVIIGTDTEKGQVVTTPNAWYVNWNALPLACAGPSRTAELQWVHRVSPSTRQWLLVDVRIWIPLRRLWWTTVGQSHPTKTKQQQQINVTLWILDDQDQ